MGDFYDMGWQARMAGKPYREHNSHEWREGWQDADKEQTQETETA